MPRFPYNLIVLDWYLEQWLGTLRVNQAELSRRTDYPKAKVSDLVTGKQRYNRDVLNDVAAALNIEPFELLMHPADAMAQRRIRQAAKDIASIPHIGSVGGEEGSPNRVNGEFKKTEREGLTAVQKS